MITGSQESIFPNTKSTVTNICSDDKVELHLKLIWQSLKLEAQELAKKLRKN